MARANINVLDAADARIIKGVGERVKALIRELRYVLATKHLNADATGSCYPIPSLKLAGGVLTVFPTVMWVACN
ncbi:MAG: hypothetical protein ACO2PN_15185 [Pyrobaculum sp.]